MYHLYYYMGDNSERICLIAGPNEGLRQYHKYATLASLELLSKYSLPIISYFETLFEITKSKGEEIKWL